MDSTSFSTVFYQILPLAIGAMIAPPVLLLQIFNIGSGQDGMKKAWYFVFGFLLVLLIWIGLGWFMSNITPPKLSTITDHISGNLYIFVSLILFALAIKEYKTPYKPKQKSEKNSKNVYLHSFEEGFVSNLISIGTMVLFVPAVQDIKRSGLIFTDEIILIIILCVFTIICAIFPIFLVMITGEKGKKWLNEFNNWFSKNTNKITGITLLLVAIALLYMGISRL